MRPAPAEPATDRSAPDALAAQPRPARRYFPELESLRGIAVSQVVALHLSGWTLKGLAGSSLLAMFVRSDRLGVDLFFVLSAFLLSIPFLEEGAGGSRVPRGRYLERRALRILPAYYLATIVGTVLSAKDPHDLLRGLPYLAFLNVFATPLPPYSTVWWSLAAEAQFYAVLPLLGFLGRSTAGRRLGVVALLLWLAGYLAFLGGIVVPQGFASLANWESSLFGRAPLFLAGIAAAALYRTHGTRIGERLRRARFMRNGGSDLLLVLVLLGVAAVLRWEQVLGPQAAWQPRYQYRDPLTAVLLAALLLLLLLAPVRSKRLLVNPLLGGLGAISYSVYLVHYPLITFLIGCGPLRRIVAAVPDVGLRPSVTFAALAAACVAVSTVTYWVVERPFLMRKARL
jgi:peptidoglycan/LPS O-acetylase OafA/YrhL